MRVEPSSTGPRARIIDPGGRILAEAALHRSDDGSTVLLTRLKGKDRLLCYYFLSAGRQVSVQWCDGEFGGRLRTRWQGNGRQWVVSSPAGDN